MSHSSRQRRPPEATTIQEQQRLFFEQLGRAVGNWQLVEMQLFRVYARLLKCENVEVASAAFHSVIGLRIRLTMTHAAARVALTGNDLSRWITLRNRIGRQSDKRNDLAHFIVIYGINRPTLPEHGPFLQPSLFDITRKPDPKNKPIDACRIRAMGAAFRRLSEDITSFANSLGAPPASSLGISI
jgi:hypothetical protein